jgi:hypothetical protein|tara:strand:- start:38825 stop:38992 length:168 start_codon:yes stop_codon:yes gene_type:complete
MATVFSKNFSYKDDPKPEYEPKKNSVNTPKAAKPPIVATIQSGILPSSLINLYVT